MKQNVVLSILILWPFISALICYLTGWKRGASGQNGKAGAVASDDSGLRRKRLRDNLVIASVFVEVFLYVLAILTKDTMGSIMNVPEICGFGISFKFEGFRIVYAGVALVMWLMTALFSKEYFVHYRNRNRYYFFYLMTLGATLGVFLSRDLYTAFIFFEIMSLTSYTWVAHDEKPAAMKAAGTYLAVAVIGGLVMLMGIIMCRFMLGTLIIDELYDSAAYFLSMGSASDKAFLYTAGGLILFGYGAKAGMFPLHIWLPKAHPVAPAPASALLSGILTKSGIYGVLVLCFEIFRGDRSWGIVILTLGVITMFMGAVLAVFSVDLKRTLACSSMSQIGFILTGCAFSVLLDEENALAAGGTVLYMVNHSAFKLVLFMCAGAVYMKLHRLNLNDIRGFGRDKALLKICFAIGALGIMGVPLFSGYISKTLIHEGIVEYSHELEGSAHTIIKTIEYLFLASGGMTVGYMLKLFVAVFVEKPSDYVLEKCGMKKAEGKRGKKADQIGEITDGRYTCLTYAALIVPCLFIVICGCVPSIFIEKLSVFMSDFTHARAIEGISIFSLENLKGFAISLIIGLLVFLFTRKCLMKEEHGQKVYVDRWPSWLDLEELVYRPLLLKVLPGFFATLFSSMISLSKLLWAGALKVGALIALFFSSLLEWLLYGIQKLFFKELVENKPTPVKDKVIKAVKENDDNIRVISSSISYGMICILAGLIFTIIYLLLR